MLTHVIMAVLTLARESVGVLVSIFVVLLGHVVVGVVHVLLFILVLTYEVTVLNATFWEPFREIIRLNFEMWEIAKYESFEWFLPLFMIRLC